MEITYYGAGAAKITGKDLTIVTDPLGEAPKLGKIAADAVTVSHDHPAHSNLGLISGTPVIISGPGEYEVKGAGIVGIASYHDGEEGARKGGNTIYVITIDEIVVCHLGDLGHVPSDAVLEEIGDVDILLVPIDPAETLDVKTASEVVSEIEPKIVIPIHYPDTETLAKFTKEIGIAEPRHEAKLKIQKRDLPVGEPQLVVLERAGA